MGTCIGSLSHGCLAAVLVALFIILLVVVHTTIKKTSYFGDAAGWVVAFCVALLSIIGLARFFGFPEAVASPGGEPREAGGLLDVILLPYVALALTILLVLLLLAAGKALHGREPRHPLGGPTNQRTIAKPGMREGDRRRREIRPFDSSKKRQIMVRKNGEMIEKTEGTRLDS